MVSHEAWSQLQMIAADGEPVGYSAQHLWISKSVRAIISLNQHAAVGLCDSSGLYVDE